MAWSDVPPIVGSAKPLVAASHGPDARMLDAPQAPTALGGGDRLVSGARSPVGHADGQLTARDGAAIAYRSSVPAMQPPKAVVVMQQGTYGRPEFFDGMGEALTTNPLSPEAKLQDAASMTVPARLFGDVTKMTGRVALKGHRMRGPLFVATAGADEVALKASTRAFVGLLRSEDKRVQNFPGLAHDLSQEWHDPRLVGALGDWVLGQAGRVAGPR